MASAPNSAGKIYAVVSRIPKGRVATYGQVAAEAGLPRRARLVGTALRVLRDDTVVPWHRVVNAQGRISPRGDALGHEELQAHLLRREGVRLAAGAISLARYQWRPAARSPKERTRSYR
jgi:methylated-DNA-protein-cysteine methyltransferase-like protein